MKYFVSCAVHLKGFKVWKKGNILVSFKGDQNKVSISVVHSCAGVGLPCYRVDTAYLQAAVVYRVCDYLKKHKSKYLRFLKPSDGKTAVFKMECFFDQDLQFYLILHIWYGVLV